MGKVGAVESDKDLLVLFPIYTRVCSCIAARAIQIQQTIIYYNNVG